MSRSDHAIELDIASFFLVCAMLAVAAWGVAAAGWTPGLWSLQFVALVAALAGLAVARSQFGSVVSALISASYGIFWVGFLLGSMLRRSLTWHERSLDLLFRLSQFANRAVSGKANEDSLMFVVVNACIFWIMGVVAVWFVARHRNAWVGFVPGGVVLLVNEIYYYGPVQIQRYLAAYLVMALLLLARTHIRAREASWRASRVGYSTEVRFEFWRAGIVAALVILALAWFAPAAAANPNFASAWQKVTSPWESVRGAWRRMFASVPGYTPPSGDYYGAALALSGGVTLSDRPIMEVVAEPGPQYYWRARTFDRYANGQWTTTDRGRLDLKADERGLPVPQYAARRRVTATFYLHTPATSMLYSVPQPYAFGRDVRLELSVNAAGEVDVSFARANVVVPRGGSYTVISTLSVANEIQLREAGSAYPAEIRERYLQMPDSISERTRALARQLAADPPTAYDKAMAIQNYLRTNIVYSRDIPPPPAGQDPVDWVLFTQRQGYCNYYASAMVMMLRSVGIPARISVGFAQGAFDLDTRRYRVVEKDAHTWPEVFFPGYGWVEFEPTASQPPVDRTTINAANLAGASRPPANILLPPERPDAIEPREAGAATSGLVHSWLWWLGMAGVGLAGLAAGRIMWRKRHEHKEGRATPAVNAYDRLLRAARLVGLTLPPSWTPRERASALSMKLPAHRTEIDEITREYETETYGHSDRHLWEAREAWRKLRPGVWMGVVRRMWERAKRNT